jgi:hypothetical protein
MSARIIDPNAIRNIDSMFLDDLGGLKTVPASLYAETSVEERAVFGMRHGLYGFTTVEMIEFLQEKIGSRKAIEIGAGHGGLAKALGILATDNRMQERAEIRAYYEALNQPVVRYGSNVEKIDALDAVRKHKPEVVVASWVTHKYDPRNHAAGGNEFGVREEDIIANCETYIFIGNSKVHAGKPIWKLPHVKIQQDWIFSRAHNGSPDFIAIWGKNA